MSQKIGIHASVWTGTFGESELASAVARTADAGYDILELPLLDPFSFDATAARRVIGDSGLVITGSLGLSEATDISGEDPNAVRAGERLLERALDVLGELGSRHLVGVIYGAMRKHDRPASEHGRANGIGVLRRIADRARAAGITIGLEVVNRYETNVINTARQALAYLDEIERPNVVLHLDTYHMNIEESDMLAPVLLAGDRLGYVHIGESHRGYLGSGTVDFGGFFRALALIDYRGPVVFESFSSAVVDPLLSNTLGVWRNLWDDSADLAGHANGFIRQHLHAVDSIRLQ